MELNELSGESQEKIKEESESFSKHQDEWNLYSACRNARREPTLTWKKVAEILEDGFDKADVVVETQGFEKGSNDSKIIKLIPKDNE